MRRFPRAVSRKFRICLINTFSSPSPGRKASAQRHLGHIPGYGVPSDIFARYQRLRQSVLIRLAPGVGVDLGAEGAAT